MECLKNNIIYYLKTTGSFIHVFMAKVLWQIVQYRRQNGTVHQMNHLLSYTRDIFRSDTKSSKILKFSPYAVVLSKMYR